MSKIMPKAEAPVCLPIQFARGEKTTLAAWIGRLNLMRYPDKISAALEKDPGVKMLLDRMGHTSSAGQQKIWNALGFQLGKQLRPVMQSMSPREAVQALCFLSDLSLAAPVKGWIIRGIFEARGNGREVAAAFVAHYSYSDRPPCAEAEPDSGLPGPRTQLLSVFGDQSGNDFLDNLIGLQMVTASVKNAKTPDRLLAISYAVKG